MTTYKIDPNSSGWPAYRKLTDLMVLNFKDTKWGTYKSPTDFLDYPEHNTTFLYGIMFGVFCTWSEHWYREVFFVVFEISHVHGQNKF